MKLIDEKGKLFGKINIIDLILGILVLCLVAGIGYKLFFAKPQDDGVTEETGIVQITFRAKNVVPEAANYVHEGDKLILGGELTKFEIVSVNAEAGKFVGMNSQGDISIASNPLYSELEIVVRAEAIEDGVGIMVNGEIFRVNQTMEIATPEFSTNAEIVGMEFEKNAE